MNLVGGAGGGDHPPPGFFERMVLTVIPQSFGADLDVLRSLWQHDDNFEKQSKSGSRSSNSTEREIISEDEPAWTLQRDSSRAQVLPLHMDINCACENLIWQQIKVQ